MMIDHWWDQTMSPLTNHASYFFPYYVYTSSRPTFVDLVCDLSQPDFKLHSQFSSGTTTKSYG